MSHKMSDILRVCNRCFNIQFPFGNLSKLQLKPFLDALNISEMCTSWLHMGVALAQLIECATSHQ